jgi:ATP-binding cassette subfamily F protein 3
MEMEMEKQMNEMEIENAPEEIVMKKSKQKKNKVKNRAYGKQFKASTTTNDFKDNIKDDQEEENMTSQITMHHDRTLSHKVDVKVHAFTMYMGGKRLLDDAKLEINYGRRYVLIGRNGCGKTTLLNHIAHRKIEGIPEHLQILHVKQEQIGTKLPLLEEVLKSDIMRHNLLKRQKEITENLADDQANSLSEKEISALTDEMIEVSNKLQRIGVDEVEVSAKVILKGLGFSNSDLSKPCDKFSGGWRMRINLAKALLVQPDILLLDEPTNHLDVNAVMWLEDYLLEWPYTIVIVSHARDFINTVATEIILIENGKMSYHPGDYDTFIKATTERKIHQRKEKVKQDKYIDDQQAFIDQFRANKARSTLVQSRIKVLEKMVRIEEVFEERPIVFNFPDPTELAPPLLRISHANLGYKGSATILKDVNFRLDMESRVAIVGPNGAGKSTLLKSITGELEVLDGNQFRHGKLKLAFFTQHHIDQLNLEFNPIEQIRSMDSDIKEERCRSHLANFGIDSDLATRTNNLLSGGQKTRVALAVLSFNEPEIIMMDEPTNHLDIDAVDALAKALQRYKGGICIVSHDSHFVEAVCNSVYEVNNEKVTKFNGTFKEYKNQVRRNNYK